MNAFQKAIIRLPCENITNALTSVNLGKPDYRNTLKQHMNYAEALRQCGLEVITLDPDNRFPDSTFVEDTALLTTNGAVITRPGASSRREEVVDMEAVIKTHFECIYHIQAPGTLDAGDILQVEQHFYIGLSQRTNREGAEQMITILNQMGFTGSTIPLQNMFHLKSGVSYLDKGIVVVAGELIEHPAFSQYKQIRIDSSESYAANCIWLNGTVLVASGYPLTSESIQKAGYPVLELEVSEFRKIDGGLSCLSLRF